MIIASGTSQFTGSPVFTHNMVKWYRWLAKGHGQGRRQSETRVQALGAPLRALTFLLHLLSPFTSPSSLYQSRHGTHFSSKYLVCWYAILVELLSSHHPGPITVDLDTAVTSRPAPRLFPPSLMWSTETWPLNFAFTLLPCSRLQQGLYLLVCTFSWCSRPNTTWLPSWIPWFPALPKVTSISLRLSYPLNHKEATSIVSTLPLLTSPLHQNAPMTLSYSFKSWALSILAIDTFKYLLHTGPWGNK